MTRIVILSAGQGTRLLPYTKDLPKCMVEISGKALLEHQIKIIKSCGINSISLIGGYKLEKLKKFKLPIYENRKYINTNMLYSLFCARELLENEDDLIISYGDIVYSKEILQEIVSAKDPISVTVDKNWQKYWESRFENILQDAETLILNKNKEIMEIGAVASNLSEIQGQYIGLIKLNKSGKENFLKLFDELSDGNVNEKHFNNAYMTDFIQELINRGKRVKAIVTSAKWIEIDGLSDLQSTVTLSRLREILSV